jgi:hypothetical protein
MGSSAGPGALAPDGSQVWSVLDESSTALRRIFEDQPGFSIAATDPVTVPDRRILNFRRGLRVNRTRHALARS